MTLKNPRFEIRMKTAQDPDLIGGLAASSRTKEAAERRVRTWNRNPRKYGRVTYEVVEVPSGAAHEAGENPSLLKPHLLWYNKIACGTNTRRRRSMLSTIALERHDFEALPESERCARCSTFLKNFESRRAKSAELTSRRKQTEVHIEKIPGESFGDYLNRKRAAEKALRHESGKNPTTSQQAANRKKAPRRKDYGQGIHVEYSPANAAYFTMWHHEVLSIRPTWEAADEHARSLIANKDKDGTSECAVVSAYAPVVLRRTQSGEPPVVEHYRKLGKARAAARRYMKRNPPGEHGQVRIEMTGGRRHLEVIGTERKNAFEWRWAKMAKMGKAS